MNFSFDFDASVCSAARKATYIGRALFAQLIF